MDQHRFFLHIPRKISIITLLSLNAIITIVIITLLSQFLLSLHIILLKNHFTSFLGKKTRCTTENNTIIWLPYDD